MKSLWALIIWSRPSGNRRKVSPANQLRTQPISMKWRDLNHKALALRILGETMRVRGITKELLKLWKLWRRALWPKITWQLLVSRDQWQGKTEMVGAATRVMSDRLANTKSSTEPRSKGITLLVQQLNIGQKILTISLTRSFHLRNQDLLSRRLAKVSLSTTWTSMIELLLRVARELPNSFVVHGSQAFDWAKIM